MWAVKWRVMYLWNCPGRAQTEKPRLHYHEEIPVNFPQKSDTGIERSSEFMAVLMPAIRHRRVGGFQEFVNGFRDGSLVFKRTVHANFDIPIEIPQNLKYNIPAFCLKNLLYNPY